MYRSVCLAGFLCVGLFQASAARPPEPAVDCMFAAAMAEQKWAVPSDVIAAIGRVESGRYDDSTKRLLPWPWTVNVAGSGVWFATLMDAVRYVRAAQAQGFRTIDVGCFQIDLYYHPEAFATLEEAFDPARNADYAAHFLASLRAETGSWGAAIGRYHSGIPAEGENYRHLVSMTQGSWMLTGPVAMDTLSKRSRPLADLKGLSRAFPAAEPGRR